ncbi:Y-family DNA polymerase [Sedimentitalea todarodis]|uniref:DNA-directed DNA polymerase n=1 Tax=Sedimentitalea todarodis TaxID=1631240 RepID=A0ABU3VLE5_9RHOB|nr:type VI secretion protein ImpB [Sedimentitalea todarodis]MDU9006790.1 type VI secretion protein ImpB [Sedimentitalea todarodis]
MHTRPANPISRLYLDFDSFFATAEQHFNPALRGLPVGVVPLDSPNTGCIAISREAKSLGVKSMASIAEARRIVPDMILVVARHDVYVRLHNRIIDVINTVVPVAHVRSIDEVVCHLLPSEVRDCRALADQIKKALAAAFSPVLTCSIGMAPTELLAKIGAEAHKPNGFVLIDVADLPGRLAHIPLNDLPGISVGMEARLHAAGIDDFTSLWAIAPKQARAIWRSVEGERFWNELHGQHAERLPTQKRMFGHSRMLPADWRSPEKVAMCARQLTLGAARRLRRADLRATKMSLGFKGGGYRSRTRSQKDNLRWTWEGSFLPARDDHTFLTTLSDGLDKARRDVRFAPRSVSVMLHGLTSDGQMTDDLFRTSSAPDQIVTAKWEAVSDLMDSLRQQHGPEAITLGVQDAVPGGYLGAKIAFGRIPDQSDFGNDPVEDADTHFCTV